MIVRRVIARYGVVCAVLAAGYLGACASPGAPPGGPEDKAVPVILKVEPESGAINVTAKNVTVRFNEVISERPRVGNSLADIVVLSPSDGPARVEWRRSSISVRPRKGFRPNTAYSLTIMPGLADLAGNPTTKARTFVFGTGATIPRGVVAGAVFDWTTLKPASDAHIEARLGGDTTFKWIARADTLGWYKLPFLPAGSYTLRSFIDANTNGKLEPRELWDSVTVGVTDSLRVDMYAFTHDTLGPRIVGVDVKDSVTLRLTFDRPLVLNPQLTAQQVEVRRADSTLVRVLTVTRAAIFDSLARVREAASKDSAQRADTSTAGIAARARADTARIMAQRDSIERARVEARRAARDTVPKVPPPVPTRLAIASEYIAVLDEALVTGAYRVTVKDAINPSLAKRTSERTFTKAKPAEKKGEGEGEKKGDAESKATRENKAAPAPAAAKTPVTPPGKPSVTPPGTLPGTPPVSPTAAPAPAATKPPTKPPTR